MTPTFHPRVHSLHVKAKTAGEHGLPKHPVREATLGAEGFVGDYNNYRQAKDKGDPGHAVLLMSIELLTTLGKEGWPVAPGDLGENATLEGFAYDTLAVGDRIALGNEIVIEIAEACDPCRKLSVLPYVGDAKVVEFIKTTLGRRGWYARVITGGRVRQDDHVALVPRPPG